MNIAVGVLVSREFFNGFLTENVVLQVLMKYGEPLMFSSK